MLGKKISPRFYEQEQLFLQNGGKFKVCKISELFYIKPNPQLDKANFVFSDNSTYPYFTRTIANNGILGYVDYLDEEHKIQGNSIAVGMLGMKFFYMRHDFYAGQFTKTAFPLFEGFNEKVALWFIAWFNKLSKKFQSVLVRDFEAEFYNTEVIVPYIKGNIAIEFIEKCIYELEIERIYELETYLKVAGFEDCTLTASETNALNLIKQNSMNVKNVKIGSLFDIHPTKTYGLTNKDLFRQKGNIPVVSNTSTNNGIADKIDLKPTEKGNMITYSDTTTSEAIFYQPFDFVGYSHVQGLYPFQTDVWTENTLLYFVTLFRKSAAGRFDYANKFNRAIASNMSVSMPITEKGTIDYDLMETYIRAIKKECIARLKAKYL